MEITSQTSCLPYRDVIQEQPGTLVRKGKQCASCAFVLCYALNVYFSVYVRKIQRDVCNFYFRSALYTKYCHISNLIVPPLCLQLLCRIFKEVHFINVYWNGSASLPNPEMLWNCNNKQEMIVLLVALNFALKYKECFSSPGKLNGHKESNSFGRLLRKITITLYASFTMKESTRKVRR